MTNLTLPWCLASFELTHAEETEYKTALGLKLNMIGNSFKNI